MDTHDDHERDCHDEDEDERTVEAGVGRPTSVLTGGSNPAIVRPCRDQRRFQYLSCAWRLATASGSTE
jgi:hypothetical protein